MDCETSDTAMAREGRELLREAIEVARQAGLWQEFRLREKKALVAYFTSAFFADLRRTHVEK